MGNYSDMNVEELKDEARSREIEGFSSLRKDELIEALEADDAAAGGETEEVAEAEAEEEAPAVEVGVDGENPVSVNNPPAKAVIGPAV